MLAGLGAEFLHQPLRHLVERHIAQVQLEAARLQPAGIQQVVNELRQPVGFFFDDGGAFAHGRRIPFGVFSAQRSRHSL